MSDHHEWGWRPAEPAAAPASPSPVTNSWTDPTGRPTVTPAQYSPAGAAPYSPAGPPPWSAAPAPRAGRSAGTVVAVATLAVFTSIGGGIAGAALYAQAIDERDPGPGVTRVVDGPRLDYTSLASIASQVSPSVVSIRIGEFGGSGVVMSEQGHIITNAHVVDVDSNEPVLVRFSTGETAQARVIDTDRRSDIGVIQVESGVSLTPAAFGDSDELLVGDAVLAIGSPLGYEGTITQGILSALDRTLRPDGPGTPTLAGLLQTDAAINRGNSGGALVNLAGEVVGINTAIAVENPDSGFLGLGFAVPSNRAIDVANQLIAGEEVDHAFLGVTVGPAAGGGAAIGEVSPGSPAEAAGLAPGDVVVRLGDRQITSESDLVSAVQAASVGEQLELEFLRDGSNRTVTVTVGEAAD